MLCPVCGAKNSPDVTICVSCGSPLGNEPVSGAAVPYSPSLQPGATLSNGAFKVGNVLGQGGFGITYKGGDMQLRRFVAIKEFFPPGCQRSEHTVQPSGALTLADYQTVKTKFLEEARTLARFNHPGIVRVFTTFEENNTAYMVMEFLEGKTLQKILDDKAVLAPKDAVRHIEAVGKALQAVHVANVIHRDIKPDNIVITDDGRVVLIDFGTARVFAAGKTMKQTAMLTPGYAPLEQYGQQARFGIYSDIYALGATLYHCLTGQLPPQATDRATGVDLKSPDQINPNVPPHVARAVLWAMQLKADQRPQTMQAFLDALSGDTPWTPGAANAGAPSAGATVMVSPNDPVNAGWATNTSGATAPSGWGNSAAPGSVSPVPPVPGAPGGSLWMQRTGSGQLLTNAPAEAVLSNLAEAFRAQNVNNVTQDMNMWQVRGTTGMSLTSYGQQVVGQITQSASGITAIVTSQQAVGITDYGRGRKEAEAIIGELEKRLRLNSQTFTASNLPQPGTMPPLPSPYAPYPPVQPQRYVQGGKGGTILTYAILGLLCCGPLGIAAWVMGNSALAEYGDYDPGDRATVNAGRTIGIISTVLWGCWLLFVILTALGSS